MVNMAISYKKIKNVKNSYDFIKIFSAYSTTLPFKRILTIIQKHGIHNLCSGGKDVITIVKNSDYKDKDCEDEFKAFSDAKEEEYNWESVKDNQLPKKAIRLDFFSTEIDSSNVNSEIKNLNDKDYLGYCVLVPLCYKPNTLRVLKALIRAPFSKDNFIILENFTTEVEFRAREGKYYRKKFKIKAFPFQEQNIYLQSCAHVTLSMFRWFMQTKKGLIKHSEFKKYAENPKTTIEKSLIYRKRSRGMAEFQITETANTFSNPAYYSTEKNPFINNPTRILYRYIDTKIPVMLNFKTEKEMHCIAIIGYVENHDCVWGTTREYYFNNHLDLPPNSKHEIDWVSHFIIQDDNLGPYLLFPYHKLEWLIEQEKAWFLSLFPKTKDLI